MSIKLEYAHVILLSFFGNNVPRAIAFPGHKPYVVLNNKKPTTKKEKIIAMMTQLIVAILNSLKGDSYHKELFAKGSFSIQNFLFVSLSTGQGKNALEVIFVAKAILILLVLVSVCVMIFATEQKGRALCSTAKVTYDHKNTGITIQFFGLVACPFYHSQIVLLKSDTTIECNTSLPGG